MKVNIYGLILLNAFRVYQTRIHEKTEKIFPEFKNISKYVIYMYVLLQAGIIILLLSVNFKQVDIVNNMTSKYSLEIIMLKVFLELILLRNIGKFSFPKKIQMIYGFLPSIFFILCSTFKHFFTLILIQLICLQLLKPVTFLILFVISCSMIFIFLYAKMQLFKFTEGLMSVILYSVSIILFIFVLQEILKIINIDLELTLRHIITFCSMAVLTVLTLLCLTYLFKNVNQTNYILKKTHSRRYAKIYIFAVVLLTLILLLSEMFELVGSIQYPLVLMSFLLITLLTKMAFINLLTLETYGYFLFYLKSAETPLQENIIKNIQMNNYLILLPVLLIHLTYFLIAGDPVFTGILLALYILDIKVDELVVYITRKVVKKNELPNLFIHTKKGLSTVLLIAFIPVALISFTIKSNQPVSASIGISIFVSLLLLLACVFLIARIWKQSFFKDLFK